MRYIPKLLGIPVLIGLASAGVMVTSTLTAAARTAADTQPPTPPYISRFFPSVGARSHADRAVDRQPHAAESDSLPGALERGSDPGRVLLADTRVTPPGFGHLDSSCVPAPTAQRFTLEAVDKAGNHSAPSFAVSRKIPGPC